MILMLNNRDSFVFNLARCLTLAGAQVDVEDSDRLTIGEIARRNYRAIVISPGPSTPARAGISVEVIKTFGADIPILGVCLGHQAIAIAYGGKVRRARSPMHGHSIEIEHRGTGVLANLPQPLQVGLYHSLVADLSAGETGLEVDATAPDGEIMALSHQTHPVFGIQFHPESILTDAGQELLKNFLSMSGPVPCH